MTAFESAWTFLKSETIHKESYHPAIHGLMNRKKVADGFNLGVGGSGYPPSDFVDEAEGMGYEPKGATGPNTLAGAEQSGELQRQGDGEGEQGVAMHHDLPSYMEEAMNQTSDKRKKREKANKLRQRVSDHDEDSKVIQYYKDNHPKWFDEWKEGAGE